MDDPMRKQLCPCWARTDDACVSETCSLQVGGERRSVKINDFVLAATRTTYENVKKNIREEELMRFPLTINVNRKNKMIMSSFVNAINYYLNERTKKKKKQ